MPGHVRRHLVYMSDREVLVIERAVLCYAQVMKIQTNAPSPCDADDTARAGAIVSGHRHCTCPPPIEEGASTK